MPGCLTPTEILDAWDAGADIVKVFPSTSLGPTFIKDVRAPLPQIKLMPTGGVSIDNAADWLRAGAVAVGVGSALVDAAAVKAGDFASITRRAEAAGSRGPPEGGHYEGTVVKVVTFGEIMLRLSPPGFERLLQSPVLSATFGGAEANVAVSLAQWGFDSVYVTRVPSNAIGDAAVRALRAEGVRTDFVLRGGDRLGIYFAESGASQRPSTVVYDRAHSSIGDIDPAAVNWAELLRGAAWFHVTGVTAALGARLPAVSPTRSKRPTPHR